MVKANVDMILDVLRTKKSVTITELSKNLGLTKEDILKSAEYLEEDGVVRIENKFPNTFITFLKDQTTFSGNEMHMPPEPPKLIKTEQANLNGWQQPVNLNTQQPNSKEMKFSDMNSQENPFKARQPSDASVPKEQPFYSSDDVSKTAPGNVSDNVNPLEGNPQFNLSAPFPGNEETTYKEQEPRPIIQNLPPYVKSDTEKIDFMIDTTTKKIENHDYNNLNALYRQIYNLYKDSDSLSPNERYLLGDKINELFLRIKRVYIIGNAI